MTCLWNAHAKPIFLRLNLLTVCDINKLQVYCSVYKAFNGHLPLQFRNLITLNKDIHNNNTRQVSDIHEIPHSTSKARANSIGFISNTLWNLFVGQMINSSTIYVRHCKMLLFHNDHLNSMSTVRAPYAIFHGAVFYLFCYIPS